MGTSDLLLIKYVINSKGACSSQDRHCIAKSARANDYSGDEAGMRLEEGLNQRAGHVDQFDDRDDQIDHEDSPFDFLFTHRVLQMEKPACGGQ